MSKNNKPLKIFVKMGSGQVHNWNITFKFWIFRIWEV